MTREQLADVMDRVFDECRALRDAGQKEYARREANAFANFERVAERVGVTREAALMVYLEKHMDGIHAWVGGHRSQRESVKGRINDAIVYLILLRGMVEESDATPMARPRCTFVMDGVQCDHLQDHAGPHTRPAR